MTIKKYVEKVIQPYIEHVRNDLNLHLKQKAFCTFDVYKAYQDKALLTNMEENGIKVVFVHATCTGQI